MNFFICYDISDNKRRLHLSKLLLRTGCHRIQKSVFVAFAFERVDMLRLKKRIDKLLHVTYTEGVTSDDSILYIPLDNDAVNGVIWAGATERWVVLCKKESLKFF